MPLRTREQALRAWYEDDPVTFLDLLAALEECKDITTEYGLNFTAHEGWRLGDPHQKTAEPDRHDYPIAHTEVLKYRGGPHMRSLISIDFPAPEMEPESAHVVSAVYVP